ncbi:hypothetical protein DES53_102319 [Roseimicrobium gellanilyticum]|uniref:DUF4149 domain-containing protein n=1 Tax=Roseimicrobium gellanilyticum TaxID=748857 RepID=A0A366HQI5_9BACT|nr:hypothetical protein [Roseimicrobium gellanilyticum]RBP45935.1 hypothetical protein DES53_102319 [Roseimicrobium gellanilyticum]
MRRLALYSFVITLVWLTFIVAISFVEAPAKFQALKIENFDVVTPALQHALAIGHRVFHLLNRIEWVCCAFSWFLVLRIRVVRTRGSVILLGVATGILAFQTFALYPTLDARVMEVMAGRIPPQTWHHIGFVVGEMVKVLTLGVLTAAQLQAFARAVLSE